MQLTDNEGKKYWRCKTFQGKKGTLIQGMEYAPPQRKVWAKNSNKHNRRKTSISREMYCTDIKINADLIENFFIKAWNYLMDHPEEIKLSWDALKDYRTGELNILLAEHGKIDEINQNFVRQTLDRIWINEKGEADVIFLCGVRV